MAELFAEEAGQGDLVIVLLHGFGGSHRDWALIEPSLADLGRSIAYDLPGHGQSLDWPEAGRPR